MTDGTSNRHERRAEQWAANHPSRIVRPADAEQLTGYTDVHLRRLEEAGDFPKRFKLAPNGGRFGACGWLLSDIETWLAERAASRDAVPDTPDADLDTPDADLDTPDADLDEPNDDLDDPIDSEHDPPEPDRPLAYLVVAAVVTDMRHEYDGPPQLHRERRRQPRRADRFRPPRQLRAEHHPTLLPADPYPTASARCHQSGK